MADSKISGLPSGTFATTDEVPVNKGGVTTRVTLPISALVPLDTTGWTWVNQGSASIAVNGPVTTLSMPLAVGTNARVFKTSTSPPWTLIAAIVPRQPGGAAIGLGLRESGTGKLYAFYVVPSTTLNVGKYTDETHFSTTAASPTLPVILPSPLWLRMRDSVVSSNVDFSYSYDGHFWVSVFSEDRLTFMTSTGPNELGLLGDCTAAGDMSVVSWVKS